MIERIVDGLANGDWENSWPIIAVSRVFSASISGAVLLQRAARRCFRAAAADLRLDRIDRLQAFAHLLRER
jgi:hypothetical protein